MFSYVDKVWAQGTTEGSFGAYTHARPGSTTVTYTDKDFTHWDGVPLGTLNRDILEQTDLYAAVTRAYKT